MSDVIKKATRVSYGEALCELRNKYNNVIVLDADVSAATQTVIFAKAHPDSFFNCGIQEANMMGVAAGLSTTGKTVFASCFAMFAAGRAFEIIRNSIAYPNLNVKIGATHAGISVGEDGATHQCNEDIALMRVIPNMTIICPSDDTEAKAAVMAMGEHKGPVYMRFGRLPVPIFNDVKTYKFELGKGVQLRDGNDVTLITSGIMVAEALSAHDVLKERGISARVINIHTIKPIDEEIIKIAAKETGKIVTIEEHSVIGGLGSAVSDIVTKYCPVPVRRIGIEDEFGVSGPAVQLLEKYGLNKDNIVKVTEEFISSFA